MTLREKAICELFTGICFCVGEQRGAVYEYAEELLGRPVMTHDFLWHADKLRELAKADFEAICFDKHTEGEWTEYWDGDYLEYSHKCSKCGQAAPTKAETSHDEILSNYCPHCGAKMGGGTR